MFQLEDQEYFNAFGNGVPIYYKGDKKIINKYDFVHFDGPHTTVAVLNEALFLLIDLILVLDLYLMILILTTLNILLKL